MNRFESTAVTRVVGGAMQALAVAVSLLLLAPVPAHAEPASQAPTCGPTRSLDQRLAAKADDPASLRRFVERTRAVYQLDLAEARQRGDAYRAAQRACTTTTASDS